MSDLLEGLYLLGRKYDLFEIEFLLIFKNIPFNKKIVYNIYQSNNSGSFKVIID